MKTTSKLSDQEFGEMLRLLNRFTSTEMDQWELWKFNNEFGEVYINISLVPTGPESAYTDLNHIFDNE